MHRTKVKIVEEALDANNTIAQANRADFERAGVKVVNFMSAPGAGKTSLLERVIGELPGVRVGVLEGDVQGSLDAERLAGLHVPVTQLNTDPSFGGECHLDANMVRSALGSLPLGEIELLMIENVGNLVCPAEFKVGEDARVMVSSVTEGEDKPLKYPLATTTSPPPHVGQRNAGISISHSRSHTLQCRLGATVSCSRRAPSQTVPRATNPK